MRFKPLLFVLAFFSLFVPFFSTQAATIVRSMAYPTDVSVAPNDDFGAARVGHRHAGNDLMGKKMLPLYATVDGWVESINVPEPRWGYAIVLRDADGYTYHYLHVNNDTPGTDDHKGGVTHAYAPGMARGVAVQKGQLIGWMGDSGNAETTDPHLHFEIRTPEGTAINPHPSLVAARKAAQQQVALAAHVLKLDIDHNQSFAAVSVVGETPCRAGSLLKAVSGSTVFYCGTDGERHAFPNEQIFYSWYSNFSAVQIFTDEKLAEIPLGKNVVYRPDSALVRFGSGQRIYAIEQGGALRLIPTPTVAVANYGKNWSKRVQSLPESVSNDYHLGEPLALSQRV